MSAITGLCCRALGVASLVFSVTVTIFALDLPQHLLLQLDDSAAAAAAADVLHDVLIIAGHRHAATGM